MLDPRPETPTADTAVAAPPFRVAIEYAVGGDLRYISHHDEMRMLTRALIRAGWPLRFSQGFNPIPRLAIPLPRRVGIASTCQWALVELHEERCPQVLSDGLAATLPPHCTLRRLIAPAPPGTPHAHAVEYTVELDPLDARSVGPRLRRVLGLERLVVQRDGGGGKPARPLDIRPYIETLGLDGPVLRMRLRFIAQRTARPSEILTELGLAADAYNHRVRRCEVTWDMELAGARVAPAAPEGTQLATEKESNHYRNKQENAKGD